MNEKEFPLLSAIEAHGETVDKLQMREPTPADARVVKALPYFIDKDENVHINATAAAQYISRCARIPMSSVEALNLSDFNQLCWDIAGFFLRDRSPKSKS